MVEIGSIRFANRSNELSLPANRPYVLQLTKTGLIVRSKGC